MSIYDYLPEVKPPKERKLSLKTRLWWTFVVLVSYFILSKIPLFGLSQNALEQVKTLSLLLGASFGTLTTLGIGPIVTASIIIQLLMGAKLLSFDTSTPKGRRRYEGAQRLLAYVLIFFEGAAYVFFGALRPSPDLPQSTYVLYQWLLVLQLALGSFLILLMDDLVSKWGIGSGISLFIAAGVSNRLFVRLFNFLSVSGDMPTGIIPLLFMSFAKPELMQDAMIELVSLVTTIFIFLFVVYVQSMRVEIPLSFANVRGYTFKWPINFLYTSNIPVILTAALFANIQLFARILYNAGYPILGKFDPSTGVAVSGLVRYLVPTRSLVKGLLTHSLMWSDLIAAIVYVVLMMTFATIFGVLWVQVSGMNAKAVAENIHRSNLQRPGFRSDKRILERLLNRYIPYVSVLGSLTVGFLAAMADILGAVVSGTGLLLTVMIIYRFAEDLARQYAEELPIVGKLLKK